MRRARGAINNIHESFRNINNDDDDDHRPPTTDQPTNQQPTTNNQQQAVNNHQQQPKPTPSLQLQKKPSNTIGWEGAPQLIRDTPYLGNLILHTSYC